MKILIVDDNVSKAGKLTQVLSDVGIPRESIEMVSTAMQARNKLRSSHFELLVVDLLLPLRQEDEPKLETALDLIEEVSERDGYVRPSRIVGFTAFVEQVASADAAFKSRLWTIVQYDPTSTAWELQFSHVARYLINVGRQDLPKEYGADICLVTALPKELEAILRVNWAWKEPEPLDDCTFVQRAHFTVSDRTFRVVAASAPRMGSVAASLLSSKLIEKFRPRFIAMPGICAGVKGKVELGDVIAFDPCWEWPSGKLTNGDSGTYLEPAPHQIPLSEFAVARLEQMQRDEVLWANIRSEWPGEKPSTALRFHIGPGASGSAVIADNSTVEAIQQQHRKLTGLDMEAYGVAAAARSSCIPKPTALVIKSVVDFANAKKSDKWHGYACHVSARTMAEFFERFIPEILDLAGS
jgi:nucleoside phosphorylase/CheY-like chemotaxis protein